MKMSRKAVCDGTAGALTEELGVVLRLRDCLPSRPLDLLLPTSGGMVGIVKGIEWHAPSMADQDGPELGC